MPTYTAKINYFKRSGKWYSEADHTSEQEHLWLIWKEIRDMIYDGQRPGLVDCKPGENDFPFVLVNVPDHPHDHPHLIVFPHH